jgi:hypothetical protein
MQQVPGCVGATHHMIVPQLSMSTIVCRKTTAALQLPASLLAKIKAHRPLMAITRELKEVNLEFMAVDSRTVVTDHPEAAVGWGE